MKIKIIFRFTRENRNSIAYLLGALENRGFTNDIILSEDIINDVVTFSDRKIIVLYSLMATQIPNLYYEVKDLYSLKKKYDIVLVAGGPYPSGDPTGAIKMGFDYVVLGEGEDTLPKLLLRLIHEKSVEDINGIAFRDNDRILIKPNLTPVDLNAYPPCSDRFRLHPPIEISRGCTYRCKYCQVPRLFLGGVRHRSIDYIVKYARHYARMGIRDLRFIAPNGFGYGSRDGKSPAPKSLKKLLRALKEIKDIRIFLGTFPSEVRPDFVTREILDIISKYVSNRRIVIGVQTGSNRLLSYINRDHTVEDCYRAAEIVLEYGFTPYLDFLFGLPTENEEDIDRTIEVMKDFINMGAIIRGHTFIPLPGTPFENSPPGRVHPKLKKFLERMIGKGVIKGEWRQQEKLAHDVVKVLKMIRDS
ncbi:MAG: TIGR04013 family B12-binding domain/radical SAM domain-containing protein [Thermoprotei archaeon]|nr:MAG: TIGR04013 family B12-binding domain/radical SAM domain-containing protein [Thermoprotei archaeon]